MTVKIIGHQWYWSYEISDRLIRDYDKIAFEDEVLIVVEEWDEWTLPIPTECLYNFTPEKAAKSFDAYMRASIENFRLLETDIILYLPIWTRIRGLVSSEDVLHSWAVPRIGIKIDACPGRINSINVLRYREGKVYGQCSEICGVNHSLMPISIWFVELFSYKELYSLFNI